MPATIETPGSLCQDSCGSASISKRGQHAASTYAWLQDVNRHGRYIHSTSDPNQVEGLGHQGAQATSQTGADMTAVLGIHAADLLDLWQQLTNLGS